MDAQHPRKVVRTLLICALWVCAPTSHAKDKHPCKSVETLLEKLTSALKARPATRGGYDATDTVFVAKVRRDPESPGKLVTVIPRSKSNDDIFVEGYLAHSARKYPRFYEKFGMRALDMSEEARLAPLPKDFTQADLGPRTYRAYEGPDSTALNHRLDELTKAGDPDATFVRTYDDYAYVGTVKEDEYLERWAREGKIPNMRGGVVGFHDMSTHVPGFIITPDPMLRISQARAQVINALDTKGFIQNNPTLKLTLQRFTSQEIAYLEVLTGTLPEPFLLATTRDEAIEGAMRILDGAKKESKFGATQESFRAHLRDDLLPHIADPADRARARAIIDGITIPELSTAQERELFGDLWDRM